MILWHEAWIYSKGGLHFTIMPLRSSSVFRLKFFCTKLMMMWCQMQHWTRFNIAICWLNNDQNLKCNCIPCFGHRKLFQVELLELSTEVSFKYEKELQNTQHQLSTKPRWIEMGIFYYWTNSNQTAIALNCIIWEHRSLLFSLIFILLFFFVCCITFLCCRPQSLLIHFNQKVKCRKSIEV